MKAYIIHHPEHASIEEIKIPEPQDDQILIKIKYCGICGTDIAIYSGSSSFVKNGLIKYPIRIGHEWSGVVEQVGKGVARFSPGDRVIGDNFVSCGTCDACRKKDYNNCINKYSVGTINCWNGALAEYMVMPERHVYKISDCVSLKQAALSEPLSVAYGAIRRFAFTPETKVAVIGTGSIGMCAAALAKYKGAGQVYLIGRNAYKLNIAKKLGITGTINTSQTSLKEETQKLTGGKGFDCIIECSGVSQNILNSIDVIAHKGKIMLVGFYEENLNGLNIDYAVSKEITITGIMGEYGNIEAVNRIMGEYDLGLDPIITEEILFEDCDERLKNRLSYHNTSIKTMVHME